MTALTVATADAPCREDPESWYPHDSDTAGIEAAKAVCRTCPLVDACLEAALDRKEQHGIWGGTDPAERDRMLRRKRQPSRKPIKGFCLNGHDVKILGRYPNRTCVACVKERQAAIRAERDAARRAARKAS